MPTPLNISASRAGAILGMSQYSTPLQVWLQIMESRQPGFCEKHNYQIPEFEYNSAMKWGHAFESAVIELAEERQGFKIIDRERLYSKPLKGSISAISCHIDGLYQNDNLIINNRNNPIVEDFIKNYYNPLTLHEGKTTSANYFYSAFGEPGTDRVPVEYQLQCQHQMICTGAEKVILSVLVFPKRVEEWEKMGYEIELLDKEFGFYRLNFKNDINPIDINKWAHVLSEMGYFHQYTIHAHADLQKLMLEAYSDFWNNHVLTETPPEPMNYDDIRAICREPVGTIISTPEIENLISEYKQIGSEISSTGTLAKRREQLKTQILNFSRTAGFTEDDESKDKWIIRGQDGKKLASYGKTEKGIFIFR
jgi:predicted phage-related endonuclease